MPERTAGWVGMPIPSMPWLRWGMLKSEWAGWYRPGWLPVLLGNTPIDRLLWGMVTGGMPSRLGSMAGLWGIMAGLAEGLGMGCPQSWGRGLATPAKTEKVVKTHCSVLFVLCEFEAFKLIAS